MQKLSVQLSPKQAEQLLDQLPRALKIRLVRRWAREIWPVRFRQLLARLEPARRAFRARSKEEVCDVEERV